MRTTQAALIVVLTSALLGCGGGGGGGSGSPPPPAAGNPPGNPPPANTPPASTGVATAEIVFPWQRSTAVGSTVIVRGTAADPDGVAAVRVNGFGAALAAASSSGSPKTARMFNSKTASASVLAAADDTNVEWSVEVELEAGETDLVVTVEDETGDETAGAAEASIKYAEVPAIFTSELGDPRLLGWSTSLTRTNVGSATRLVQFDTASREQTIYPELSDIGIASCFRSQLNEFLYIVGAWEDWQLRRFDLTTRQRSDVADLSLLLTAGPGFSSGPFLIELVCSSSREHAYVLASYSENGPWVKSRVVEVALSGSARILTETDPSETPLWIARRMTLADDALIAVGSLDSSAPLTLVSLTDGARTPLAPTINVIGLAMTALDRNRVYLTTFDGVDEVTVNPPSKTNISPVSATEPLIFSQANSIGLDLVNDRVIVGDTDLDALIAVDRATGQRSELVSRKLGAGPPLIAPRRLAVTADGATVYVVDDGANAAERLFEVDLATSDRRVRGQVHEQGVNRSLTGLALDEENGNAYVARYDRGTVLRVDLDTELVEPITSDDDGLLQQIEDIALDAAEQRLLIADSETDSIVAVDVVTLQKQVISRAGGRGDGPAFETPTSLTLVPDETAVYAADQATDDILRVDLESGDREVLETACGFGSSQSLRQILYDAGAGELLIVSAHGIFIHDLETSQCTQIPLPIGLSVLGIQLTPDGRLLGAGFNAVLQIDRASGDVVIVSK